MEQEVKTALEAVKSELQNTLKSEFQSQIEELKKENEQLKKNEEKNQQALDAIIAERKNLPAQPVYKSAETQIEEGLTAKKEVLKKYAEHEGKGFSIELARKAVGNMGSSTNLTGSYFVTPTVVPGLTLQPYEEIHMRNILPVGSTNSNIIRYVRDNGGEGGPSMVAEAGTKPQIDRDLQVYDAPVRKIACYFRVPEEMIEDIPYLSSFLTQIGLEEVQKVEDAQVLYGDGTGQNLTGLATAATAFAAGTSTVTDPNQYDVIRAAKKQLRLAKLGGPLVGLISPTDWFTMRSEKDTTNNYIFLGGGNGVDLSMNIDGVQLIESTDVTAGDFFVLQPRAAQIFDRTGTSVRFYDQDQDNAIKNLITIVIEKRLALAIYRPAGIIKGTFTAAITDLTS